MHAKGELVHAVSNGDADTDDRCENGGRIDHPAHSSRELGIEDRRKGRANGQWHVAAIGEVGERHADDGVAAPRGEAVVEQCPLIGCGQIVSFQCGCGAHDHIGIVREMGERFRGGIGQHADTDTRAKHHRKPSKSAELRCAVVGAKTNLSRARQ